MRLRAAGARSGPRARRVDRVARRAEAVDLIVTAEGPVGLVTGKKAYVFATRGGLYKGTPSDTQTPYVRDFLGFIGITEVEFIYAHSLADGNPQRERSLVEAGVIARRLAAA